MKKTVIALLFMTYTTQLLFAQEQKKVEEKKNTFLIAPLNLLNFINPSIQVGYERLLSKKFAYQIEAGYIINHSLEEYIIDWARGVKDCEYTNKGFIVKNELKYFVIQKRKIKLYSSFEVFYLKNRSGGVGTFVISDPDYQYSEPVPEGSNGYDDFFINDLQKIGLNIKFGVKIFPRARRFLFEPHIGLGIAFQNTKQYDRENINDKLYDSFLESHLKNGNSLVFSFPLNVKLGYRF